MKKIIDQSISFNNDFRDLLNFKLPLDSPAKVELAKTPITDSSGQPVVVGDDYLRESQSPSLSLAEYFEISIGDYRQIGEQLESDIRNSILEGFHNFLELNPRFANKIISNLEKLKIEFRCLTPIFDSLNQEMPNAGYAQKKYLLFGKRQVSIHSVCLDYLTKTENSLNATKGRTKILVFHELLHHIIYSTKMYAHRPDFSKTGGNSDPIYAIARIIFKDYTYQKLTPVLRKYFESLFKSQKKLELSKIKREELLRDFPQSMSLFEATLEKCILSHAINYDKSNTVIFPRLTVKNNGEKVFHLNTSITSEQSFRDIITKCTKLLNLPSIDNFTLRISE